MNQSELAAKSVNQKQGGEKLWRNVQQESNAGKHETGSKRGKCINL